MKRDAIKTLTRIRDICNHIGIDGNIIEGRDPKMMLAEIEWNCRHALEDYSIKCTWWSYSPTNEKLVCDNDAVEKWTHIPQVDPYIGPFEIDIPAEEDYRCPHHIAKAKEIFLNVFGDELKADEALKSLYKMEKFNNQ